MERIGKRLEEVQIASRIWYNSRNQMLRESIMRRISQNLRSIIVVFVCLCSVDLWPLIGGLSASELQAVLPDEYQFMSEILRMQDILLYGRLHEFLSYGTPYGYGFLYWVLMGIIGVPFHSLDYEQKVLFYRLVGIFFKAAAIYYLYRGINLKFPRVQSVLGCVFILVLPGYWFYGKVISPEFILLGLLSLSIYLLLKDDNKIGKWYWISVIVFASALNIKISLAPIGMMWASYLVVTYKKGILKEWKKVILTPTLVVITFLIFNVTLITKMGRNSFDYWLTFNKGNTHFPTWSSIKNFYYYNYTTWDRIPNAGMKVDYLSTWLLIMFFAVVGYLLFINRRSWYTAIPITLTSLLYLYFVIGTQITHSWYFFPVFLLIAYAIFASFKFNRLAISAVSIFLIITLMMNYPRIEFKYKQRISVNQDAKNQLTYSSEIQEYLKPIFHEGDGIMFNPFLAMPTYDLKDEKVITSSDFVVLPHPYIKNLNSSVQWIVTGTKNEEDLNKLTTDGALVDDTLYKFKLEKEFSHERLYKRVLP
jgi:hypothetical protein